VQIVDVLNHIAKKEKVILPEKLAMKIAGASDRNLRRAILMFEATKVQQYPFLADQKVNSSDWEMYIGGIANSITQEQSPLRLLQVRSKLYELLGNCIPPDVIMKTLVKKLLARLDDALKPKVIEFAAFFEHRMKIGSKPIYHLEAFVAKFMSTYKAYVVSIFGG